MATAGYILPLVGWASGMSREAIFPSGIRRCPQHSVTTASGRAGQDGGREQGGGTASGARQAGRLQVHDDVAYEGSQRCGDAVDLS